MSTMMWQIEFEFDTIESIKKFTVCLTLAGILLLIHSSGFFTHLFPALLPTQFFSYLLTGTIDFNNKDAIKRSSSFNDNYEFITIVILHVFMTL